MIEAKKDTTAPEELASSSRAFMLTLQNPKAEILQTDGSTKENVSSSSNGSKKSRAPGRGTRMQRAANQPKPRSSLDIWVQGIRETREDQKNQQVRKQLAGKYKKEKESKTPPGTPAKPSKRKQAGANTETGRALNAKMSTQRCKHSRQESCNWK